MKRPPATGRETTGQPDPEERRAATAQAARQQNEDGQATEEETPAVTCADFKTQEEAQAAFDKDPEGLADLDPDGNGIACEELLESEPTAEPAATAEPGKKRQAQSPQPGRKSRRRRRS